MSSRRVDMCMWCHNFRQILLELRESEEIGDNM